MIKKTNDESRAEIEAIPNPREYVLTMATRLLERNRLTEADAGDHLSEYYRRCADHLRRFNYDNLPGEVEKLDFALRSIHPAVLAHEAAKKERELMHQRAVNGGWSTLEIEILERMLEPGEHVIKFAWDSCVTNRRVLDRHAIRMAAKPPSWTREDTWLSQFPSIRPPGEKKHDTYISR
jgi:hypothetical protein